MNKWHFNIGTNSFIKYGIVGVLSVTVDFLLLFIFLNFLYIELNLSVTLAFILSTFVNFLMHKNYTFQDSSKNFYYQLIKYILLICMSYFITIYSINYFVNIGLNVYISKFITVCIVSIYGYLFGRFFIFKGLS